jgi:hypothetical protein
MNNGKKIAVEDRLKRLETDIQQIKTMLLAQQEPKDHWWKPFVGMFANDPVADEVRKMIEETREKERRKARRKPARKKKQPAGG